MANISEMQAKRDMKKKMITDSEGKKRWETDEELDVRLKKEVEEREKTAIEDIMKIGFTRKQAEYLRQLEIKIHTAAHSHVPYPILVD